VEAFAKLLRISPGVFFVPGNGDTALQPLHVIDLIGCLSLTIADGTHLNQLLEIGGGEILSFRDILQLIMEKINVRRYLVNVQPAYLRMFVVYIDQIVPKFPLSLFWLDSLAEDRTTSIDVLPRQFGILPMRFSQSLDFIQV